MSRDATTQIERDRHVAAADGPKREQGQIIVLFVFALVVIMGFAALVIDVGVLRNANQNLWNALDAGALAGASQLPADATNADAIALAVRRQELPRRAAAGRDGRLPLRHRQRGRLRRACPTCPPSAIRGRNALWTCNSTICQSTCVPAEGDTCNTVVLEGDVDRAVPLRSARRRRFGDQPDGHLGRLQGPVRSQAVHAGRSRARRRPDVEHERHRHGERPCRRRVGPQGLQPGGAVDGASGCSVRAIRGQLRHRCPTARSGRPTCRPTCTAGCRSS